MITIDNLYYFTDGETVNSKRLTTFTNDQIITTYGESEMIDLNLFDSGSSVNILIVKLYFYGVSNDNCRCNTDIKEIKGYYSEVFTIKCSGGYCYYIVGIINTKKKITIIFNSRYTSWLPEYNYFWY